MIVEFLSDNSIILEMSSRTKEEAIKEFISAGVKLGKIADGDTFFQKVMEKENLASSGLEHGIAIPHLRDDCVEDLFILIGISKRGIDFGSIDSSISKILFFIGAKKNDKRYLPILARISRLMMDRDNRDDILEASSPGEIVELISEREQI
ncbi:MAG TPA: PTS sugar transporter subunit IIA [Firmicutes bacterium]|nr:PTS sugar transporter subunit IIA [Bacillota bacterium]